MTKFTKPEKRTGLKVVKKSCVESLNTDTQKLRHKKRVNCWDAIVDRALSFENDKEG